MGHKAEMQRGFYEIQSKRFELEKHFRGNDFLSSLCREMEENLFLKNSISPYSFKDNVNY